MSSQNFPICKRHPLPHTLTPCDMGIICLLCSQVRSFFSSHPPLNSGYRVPSLSSHMLFFLSTQCLNDYALSSPFFFSLIQGGESGKSEHKFPSVWCQIERINLLFQTILYTCNNATQYVVCLHCCNDTPLAHVSLFVFQNPFVLSCQIAT